jgi:hypothetical protein
MKRVYRTAIKTNTNTVNSSTTIPKLKRLVFFSSKSLKNNRKNLQQLLLDDLGGPQDVHSDLHKRRITAFIFTVLLRQYVVPFLWICNLDYYHILITELIV